MLRQYPFVLSLSKGSCYECVKINANQVFLFFSSRLGHYLSQVGWYALRMVGEIFGFGIRKKYGEALCCLPEAVWCNTVNPDRGFVLI